MKKGFTLAEVLITLGIIGVVAAITLPQLIYNYQKKTWVEGLKVGVSTLEQGLKKALADDGVDKLRDTELYKKCDGELYNNDEEWFKACNPMMKKYFKDIKAESVGSMQSLGDTTNIITDTAKCKQLVGKTNKWWYLNDKTKCRGWKNIAYTLSNGMRVDMLTADYGYFAGQATVDINGGKGPNTWGRDTFLLVILNDGRVVGKYSSAHAKAKAEYNNIDFETVYNSFKTQREAQCSKTTTEDGTSCSGRVIDEGWVMNY